MPAQTTAVKSCAAFKLGAAVAESDGKAVENFAKLIKVGMPYAQYKVENEQFRLGYETKSTAKTDELREQAARQAWSRLMRKVGLSRSAERGVFVADVATAKTGANTKGKKAPTAKGKTGATMSPEMDTLFGKEVAEYIRKHATLQGEIIKTVQAKLDSERAANIAKGRRAA